MGQAGAADADGDARDASAVEALLPLSPGAYPILLALATGERHGYALIQEVRRLSDGMVRLGPGTFYRTLKGLLDAGLIGRERRAARPRP